MIKTVGLFFISQFFLFSSILPPFYPFIFFGATILKCTCIFASLLCPTKIAPNNHLTLFVVGLEKGVPYNSGSGPNGQKKTVTMTSDGQVDIPADIKCW